MTVLMTRRAIRWVDPREKSRGRFPKIKCNFFCGHTTVERQIRSAAGKKRSAAGRSDRPYRPPVKKKSPNPFCAFLAYEMLKNLVIFCKKITKFFSIS